ncbi:MAG: type II toxin-antitoxin system RelE/ParE family toxin [Clostridium sp.]|jgi:addiction module RelE/StbE family toxin|nr:type II toxin-antitoxin system RelE/ParE family toxin [Clostridium sp.]
MNIKIKYSPESLNDLDAIWEYIFIELANPDAADHVINSIMEAISNLETFPEMGAPLSSVTDIESDYRFISSGGYLIFYRSEDKNVYIDRILYGKRDYLSILFPEKRN